jgi:alkylation response protein AidB-like acyl-CoA dehydrogenase
MINHHSCEVFFDDLRVPASSLIGEEGRGFRYMLDGMNAERVLIAAEYVARFIARAREYARDRIVFGRPIGQNQGVRFSIARAYAQVRGDAARERQVAHHVRLRRRRADDAARDDEMLGAPVEEHGDAVLQPALQSGAGDARRGERRPQHHDRISHQTDT